MNQDPMGTVFGLGFILFYCAVILVAIVSMRKVFEKTGRPGWYSIVPLYNLYQLIKIAGRPGWWFLLCLIPLVNVIVVIVLSIDIAHRFGRSTSFGVGLALLSIIFYAILAFSDASYDGGGAA